MHSVRFVPTLYAILLLCTVCTPASATPAWWLKAHKRVPTRQLFGERVTKDKLVPGDHIRYDGSHAIVSRVLSDGSVKVIFNSTGGIFEGNITMWQPTFTPNDKLYRLNHRRLKRNGTSDNVVARATQLLEKYRNNSPYNGFIYNCESFANQCVTGIPYQTEVPALLFTAIAPAIVKTILTL